MRDQQQRARLFERLSRIQRSISHRAPLGEVLDATTAGLSELMGDDCAAVRLIDQDDPSYAVNVSYAGLSPEVAAAIRRTPVGQGAGGRAIAEERLVVIDDYADASSAIPDLARSRLTAAMAAPLLQGADVVGSLIVASFQPGRRYDSLEQEALVAFAEHASLALTDARAMEELREGHRSKEMFFAMVSHELKTPLTVIMATLHTLQRHRGDLDDSLRDELLKAAYERSQHLGRLINRLLQGSRAELAGNKEEVSLPELVAASVSGFRQTHSVVVPDVPELTIRVDASAVQEIVGILLENAVSHSPERSPVWVETHLEGSSVAITVRNKGSLPEDIEPESLFMPFERSSNRPGGVGLGLYIAARLAESLEGTLELASGNGSVGFTLEFPYRDVEEGAERSHSQQTAQVTDA